MPGIRHDDHDDDDELGMAPTVVSNKVTGTVCSQINRSSVVSSKRRVECGVYRILIVFATSSSRYKCGWWWEGSWNWWEILLILWSSGLIVFGHSSGRQWRWRRIFLKVLYKRDQSLTNYCSFETSLKKGKSVQSIETFVLRILQLKNIYSVLIIVFISMFKLKTITK